MDKLSQILIAFLFISLVNAQTRKICTYQSYFPVSNYVNECGFKKPKRNMVMEQSIDSILATMGLERNFQIKSCSQVEEIWSMNLDPFYGQLERYVIIPEEMPSLNSMIKNEDWELVGRVLHAAGHHLRRQLLIDSVDFFEDEIEADEAVGFILSKMGVAKENSVKAVLSITDSTVAETHSPTVKRKNAMVRGWNWAQDGTSTLSQKDYIELLPFSEPKELDYMQQHKTLHKSENFELAAWDALKAFQHSGGKNREMLFEAAYHFHQNSQYHMSMKCYLTLLEYGIGFMSRNGKSDTFATIGINYFFLRKWDRAIRYLSLAHSMSPEDVQILNYLAASYEKKGDWEMCASYIKKMIVLDASNPDYPFNLGVMYEKQKIIHKAISLYQRAFYIAPEHSKSRVALASLYSREANGLIPLLRSNGYFWGVGKRKYNNTKAAFKDLLSKAEEVLTEGLDINPNDTKMLETLLLVYRQKGDKEKQEQIKKRLEVLKASGN